MLGLGAIESGARFYFPSIAGTVANVSLTATSDDALFSGSAFVAGAQFAVTLDGLTFIGGASTGSFSGSISDADIDRIVAAVIAALNATTIPVDVQKMNSAEVIGDGSEAEPWRGLGVPV